MRRTIINDKTALSWIRAALLGAAMALWAGASIAWGEVQDPVIEALNRQPRIEFEGTNDIQQSNSTSAGVQADHFEIQSNRTSGFLGAKIGPLFVAGAQQNDNSDVTSLSSRDRLRANQKHGMASWVFAGLLTDDSDGLILLYTGSSNESTRQFNNSVNFRTADQITITRRGVFYQIFGLGIGYVAAEYEQSLRHEEFGIRVIDEQYSYSSLDLVTSLNLRTDVGFFFRSYFVNSKTEGAKGRQFDLASSQSVNQVVTVGWSFSDTSGISLNHSIFVQSTEITDLVNSRRREQKFGLEFRIGDFSIGLSETIVTTREETELTGGLDITDAERKLTRISVGYSY